MGDSFIRDTQYVSTPNWAGPLPSSSSPPLLLRHVFYMTTNINNSVIYKLECFLRPFLKTCHDEWHILSNPLSDFWKCPKKGFKKQIHFLPHFFTCLVLSDPLKLFQKSSWYEWGPYMAYILYISFFYPLYKKGVLGVQKMSSQVSHLLAILAIKMADFLKLELFLRPFL